MVASSVTVISRPAEEESRGTKTSLIQLTSESYHINRLLPRSSSESRFSRYIGTASEELAVMTSPPPVLDKL
ncbi:unnamed protein product [Linum tenue]|uniref:Uncharacterized protein n=1 Tax=Linum tenue TaxID=586396 RepID=A0AAV0IJS6_9ROSI|nr:unnamed protein product [Linum tenue]